jgi:hypothetical protein
MKLSNPFIQQIDMWSARCLVVRVEDYAELSLQERAGVYGTEAFQEWEKIRDDGRELVVSFVISFIV